MSYLELIAGHGLHEANESRVLDYELLMEAKYLPFHVMPVISTAFPLTHEVTSLSCQPHNVTIQISQGNWAPETLQALSQAIFVWTVSVRRQLRLCHNGRDRGLRIRRWAKQAGLGATASQG